MYSKKWEYGAGSWGKKLKPFSEQMRTVLIEIWIKIAILVTNMKQNVENLTTRAETSQFLQGTNNKFISEKQNYSKLNKT